MTAIGADRRIDLERRRQIRDIAGQGKAVKGPMSFIGMWIYVNICILIKELSYSPSLCFPFHFFFFIIIIIIFCSILFITVTVEMGNVAKGSRIYLRDGTLAGTVHRMTNNIGEPLSSLIKGDKGVHLILAKVSGLSTKIIYGMTVHRGDTLHALGEK